MTAAICRRCQWYTEHAGCVCAFKEYAPLACPMRYFMLSRDTENEEDQT